MRSPVGWLRRLQAYDRRRPLVCDAALAALLTLFGLAGVFSDGGDEYRDPDALAVVLALATTVPYVARRRWPLAVLMVSSMAVVLTVARDLVTGILPGVLLLGCYTVGSLCTSRRTAVGALYLAALLAYVAVDRPPNLDDAGVALQYALYAAGFGFGLFVRSHRLYTAAVEEREVLLARERDEEAARAVAQERLQIARELHDVVAHSLSVIAVQAGVGRHVLATDPDEAGRSLDAISTTSRSTLAEMRRILGVLRGSDGRRAGPEQPVPGLDDLGALTAEVCRAGVPVVVETVGVRDAVPPGLDLTAYRIVQEALTNVLNHAGPAARATVTVRYCDGAVDLEITDDGRGVAAHPERRTIPGGGNGVVGMRERAAVYGGSVTAGPRAGGGYQVTAHLPYRDAPDERAAPAVQQVQP